ncbi:MAG: aldo/keto reductase [Eubacteriales bacterium]|nr:aldo/keto reductase [Eubacteriales bacterium]
MKMVTLPDGVRVPAVGQGTWYLGENKGTEAQEIEALRAGIDAGLTLIDTAEMYGSGASERLIGKAIQGFDREKLFLVSKVYPHNAGRAHIFQSCENSLRRLGTDYLDLYLLHWRGSVPFRETVECMQELIRRGLIRRWGVSNLDIDDMEELWRVPGGSGCSVNQVLYHAASRGIEYSLLPWMRTHGVPLMAYCPLAQAGDLDWKLYESQVLQEIADAHHASIAQVLIAFAIRDGSTIAIPRSGKKAHTLDNAKAAALVLSEAELARIDQAFPAPRRKEPLDIV